MDLTRGQFSAFRKSPEFGVFQLNEYVHAFRASSDRARYVIFITTAVSLLMLIAAWNYHGFSWSRRAADIYYQQRARSQAEERNEIVRQFRAQEEAQKRVNAAMNALSAQPVTPAQIEELRNAVSAMERLRSTQAFRETLARRWTFASWMQREHELEWYGGQTAEFYGRGVFVPVPGLGASIHVNDMAILGGLVLLTLTALLWLSLIRQHENLYLAFFKIGQIRSLEEDPSDGDSVSNLMYHTLAMAQVLSHPPTLARWNRRLRHQIVHAVGTLTVYFTPALVHGGIVLQNILSRHRAYEVWTREITHVRLGVQVLFALGIFTFCLLAFLYARSCDHRWRKTFFLINPGLRRIEQRPWAEWVGLAEGDIPSKDMRRLARELTYRLEVVPVRPPEIRRERSGHRPAKELDLRQHGMTLRGTWECLIGLFHWRGTKLMVTQREMTAAVNELFTQCAGKDEDPRRTRIRNIRVLENRLTIDKNKPKLWNVRIRADVEYPPV